MSGFSSHTKKIQDNLNVIISKVIPSIDKSLVFISDTFLYQVLKTKKLYIVRGLHFGGSEDALHFNIKIVGYDTEFHVYVGLDYEIGHFPLMLLFITDSDYTIPKLYEYLHYMNYGQYLLFSQEDKNINDILKYYENIISKNQQLYKKYKNQALVILEPVESKEEKKN